MAMGRMMPLGVSVHKAKVGFFDSLNT